MLLADSNIWLALCKHEFHDVARSWFPDLGPSELTLFCRSTQQSFLRLLTTRAVLAPYGIPPMNNEAAWSAYKGFLADERISWAEEPCGLEFQWKKLAWNRTASPKLWMDAYVAAFALAGGFQLATTDKAFKQFKGPDPIVLSAR